MRPIDCHKAKKAIHEHGTNMMRTETVLKILDSIPTLTQPNEAFTIEQLREMGRFSPPIWDECLHEWCAVRPDACAGQHGVVYFGGGSRPLESGRFYRRPPEEEEDM